MALFGAPVATADHPDRALAAAGAMHLHQDAVNVEWASECRTPFGLGIGVVTGTVAATLLGSEQFESQLVKGRCTPVAPVTPVMRPGGATT
jgi:class 3 adenylate cyclase